jgi:hypothetical protein
MRKVPAGIGTVLINRAIVPVQKHASVFGAPQNQAAVIFRSHGVPFDELSASGAYSARQAIDFAFGEIGLRHFAAVGAGAAIDLFLDLLGHAPETPLLDVVGLHETPEPLVFRAFLFAEPLDLNQIRNHQASG